MQCEITIIILFERSAERYICKILLLANSDNPLSLQDKMLFNDFFFYVNYSYLNTTPLKTPAWEA